MSDDISRFDPNNEKSLQVVSSVDDETSLNLKADPTNNNALYTDSTVSSSALPTGASTSAKQLPNDHDVNVTNMIPAVETGLATSVKQLADNHQVTVSNPTADPETGLSTLAEQQSQTTLLTGMAGFTVTGYDYIALTYVAAGNGAGEIETAIFKTGGSGGTTITTLTLAYNSDDEISSVTKT